MKKILSLLLGILSLCACANDNKQIIQMSQLPAPAQTIVATYAAEETVAVVVMEKDLFETEYEIRFANGNEWKFDQNGAVESLDNSVQALPMELIPSAIVAYVNRCFPNQGIREYSVDRRDYEITLMSGAELTFNKSFELIKTDLD
ncbi:MAG: PepSY-like domain-containing protein [Paludibacteraceae bacterium]|nr:PepSY-like domain-containing protein [Paludibacteraceae bacterium]